VSERLIVLVVRLLQSSTVRCVFYLLVFGRLSTMLVNVGNVDARKEDNYPDYWLGLTAHWLA
jgi:hypothetical protein